MLIPWGDFRREKKEEKTYVVGMILSDVSVKGENVRKKEIFVIFFWNGRK